MGGPERDRTADDADQEPSDAATISAAERPAELDSDGPGHDPTVASSPVGARGDGHTTTLPVVSKDHYEILEEHDRGGLGRIMRARDKRTGRVVAIKEILEGRRHAAERFEREALITANLQHPAIVPVYEVGQWESGAPFYAMKLVSGCSLADTLKNTKTLEDRLALLPHIIAVADALAFAHSEGIIHRDLKPGNVLVGSFGETVVIDWGLAKRITDDRADVTSDAPLPESVDADITRAGSIVGTPAYMSPEQGGGSAVDERSDVYALGAMLYELLTGERPFAQSTSVQDLLAKLAAGPPMPIVDHVANVPRDLMTIAETAMAHDRNDRYRTASELADELRKFQTGKLVGAHSYTSRQLVRRWLSRHKTAVAVAAVGLVVMTILATVSFMRVIRERDRADVQSHRAESARRQAVQRLASLYAAQGRQALTAGRFDEAAVYLSKAYSLGIHSAGLRTSLSRAMVPLDRRAKTVTIKTPGQVETVSWLRSGANLLTSTTKGLIIWNAKTGAKVTRLAGAPVGVKGHAVSPDGLLIAAVSRADNSLIVWSTKTWQRLWAVASPGGTTTPIPVFSGDSTLVAVATLGHGVNLFSSGTGVPQAWLVEPNAHSVAFSPNNSRVLVGTIDPRLSSPDTLTKDIDSLRNSVGTVSLQLWDPQEHERLRTMTVGTLAVTALQVVSDTEVVLLAGASFQHWDYKQGKKLGELPRTDSRHFRGLYFRPESTTALAWTSDGTAMLWDVKQRVHAGTLSNGHTGPIIHAGMSSDGRLAFSHGRDGTLNIWDRVTEGIVSSVTAPRAVPNGAAMTPAGSRIALIAGASRVDIVDHSYRRRFVRGATSIHRVFDISRSSDGTQALIMAAKPSNLLVNLNTHKAQGTLGAEPKPPTYGHFAKAANRIALVDAAGTLTTYDSSNGKRMALWHVKGKRLAISDDGVWVAAETDNGQVALWRTDTAELAWKKKPFQSIPTSFRFSPNNDSVAVTSATGEAALFQISDGAVTKLASHKTNAFPAAFSPGGERVIMVSDDRVAQVSDVASGEMLFGLDAKVVSATMSKQHIATGSPDGHVTLWDGSTGNKLVSWQAARTGIILLNFDSAGGRLIVSAQNGPVQVWDTNTRTLLLELKGHRGGAIPAYFLANDDRIIALGTDDGVYRIWDVAMEKRPPAAIERQIACLGLFRLDGGTLVANKPAPKRCK